MAARDCNGCKSHGQTFPSGVTYCVERAEEGRDSILCTAALLGHTNCVRILVEYREADVEELGSVSAEGPLVSGVSPLWCAASNGHYWVVDYLLSKAPIQMAKTSFNGTPLQAACALGYFEIVRLLEEHGAYIEAADNRAVTCLMLASFGGHLEIVKYLLEVGADVNGKNIEGESALHACAKAGHLEVMKLLLEHNARTGPDYSVASVTSMAELIHPKTQDNSSCPSDGEFSEVNTLEELETRYHPQRAYATISDSLLHEIACEEDVPTPDENVSSGCDKSPYSLFREKCSSSGRAYGIILSKASINVMSSVAALFTYRIGMKELFPFARPVVLVPT
ncbi:protein fem-1 homolog C-like [Macrobrachium nipponense]|uniref:protein fem-1 homolog C-like n=1 Tax=Macrobrachium nipponense TaxID=159736 RepID=UPI0030C7EA16